MTALILSDGFCSALTGLVLFLCPGVPVAWWWGRKANGSRW